MLPPEKMPVSGPAAPQLRFARVKEWLGALGYAATEIAPDASGALPRGRGTARALSRALGALLSTPWLGLRALRDRPALVFANTPLNAPALALIKLLLRDEVVVLVDVLGLHSLEVDRTTRLRAARAVYRPIWLRLERLLFSCADVVLTVNDRHAKVIAEIHRRADVQVLRDAAELELAAMGRADRRAFGLPGDGVAVCFVGSLICSRLDPLFDAWGDGTAGGERGYLVVIGDGPDLHAYRRRARQHGWLGTSVFFLGAMPRDDALRVVRACDIAYSDCWNLGFPLKVFEYMALGMPMVVEGRPQLSEILTDGRNALFHGPDGPLHCLRQLARNPELRARLGAAARETFLAGHTLRNRQLEFESLFVPDQVERDGAPSPQRVA